MGANIIPALQKRAWIDNMDKQILQGSIFEQFSSRVSSTESVQNDGSTKVSKSVIRYVSDKFNPGTMYVTIPTMDKLKKRGPMGWEKADGTEETVKLRYAKCYYNVQRKAVTFADGTVEGDATKGYPILTEKARLMGDYFAELSDYDKQRSFVLGAAEHLTESAYWQGSSDTGMNAAPVKLTLHPRSYVIGQSGTSPVAWNATFATHVASLVTALRSANSSANATFTKAKLDKVIGLANRTVVPLTMKSGNGAVRYIIALSQVQADQLQADTADGGWWKTFTEAGARGNENLTISGLLGIYRECMLIVNIRAPLFNATGSGAYSGTDLGRFQFVKPWADSSSNADNIDAGENRVPTTYVYNATAASDVGTFEIGYVMGGSGIMEASVKNLEFNEEDKDYNFSKGFEARRSIGTMRSDFTKDVILPNAAYTTTPDNWSSFTFYSPTAAGSL
jgi:hypothetical protein